MTETTYNEGSETKKDEHIDAEAQKTRKYSRQNVLPRVHLL